MKENLKILSGLLIGVGIGTMASILLLPDQRKKTKKKILDKAEQFVDDLESGTVHKVDQVRDKLVETVDKYADRAKERIRSNQPEAN